MTIHEPTGEIVEKKTSKIADDEFAKELFSECFPHVVHYSESTPPFFCEAWMSLEDVESNLLEIKRFNSIGLNAAVEKHIKQDEEQEKWKTEAGNKSE